MAGVHDRGAAFDGVVIGRPATGALLDAGYVSLVDLPDDLDILLELHGVGPSAVAKLHAAHQAVRLGSDATVIAQFADVPAAVGPDLVGAGRSADGSSTRAGPTRRRMDTPNTVDTYIAEFPPEVAERLTELRMIIARHFDGGWETVRYGMPAVMLGPRYGLHFAGWKKHIALYPVPALAEPLESRVAPYRSGKDAVTFRHTQELPYELVGQICDAIAEHRRDAEVASQPQEL